jgi:hypothetical protein
MSRTQQRCCVCVKRVGEWERSDRCAWPALFASCLHTKHKLAHREHTARRDRKMLCSLEPLILGKCRSRYGKRRRRQLTSSAATLIWMDAAELAQQIRKLVHSIREHLIRYRVTARRNLCSNKFADAMLKKNTVRFNPLGRVAHWINLRVLSDDK